MSDAPSPAAPTAPDELNALRAIAEGTAGAIGEEFFQALVRHLARAIPARYAFVAEFAGVSTRVRTLAYWFRDRLIPNVEFDLAGTPCEEVVKGNLCHHPAGVMGRFPHDRPLVELGIESYLGVPLLSPAGEHLGHLAVFDERPMPPQPRNLLIFRIFAARAAAELARLRAERERVRLGQQNEYLREEIKSDHNFEEVVGRSGALRAVLGAVARVAPTDATVLITGETGTGKELIARAVHSASRRKDRPLIKINCAALPTGLVESELFGHEKGAFTGAIARRVGRFELADGGTLFLDEVGDIPPEAQAKLLRVLQEREFDRVGGTAPRKVDVRVIAATNRDLLGAVRDRTFREDLYYRLSVFPVPVPPLRERREDIPLLVHFFVGRFAARVGKRVERIDVETMRLLCDYPWPGNVRELQNVLERAVILAAGPTLEIDPELLPVPEPSHPAEPADGASLGAVERNHILSVLQQTRWVIDGAGGAAKVLGLHPNTLRSRMKKLGIARPAAAP